MAIDRTTGRLDAESRPRPSPGPGPMMDAVDRLWRSGRSWFAAEARLAQAELSADGSRLIWLAVIGGLALVCAWMAVLLLAFGVVAAIAPFVGGLAKAAGIMGAALAVVAVLCAWWTVHSLRSRMGVMALLKRWQALLRQGPPRDASPHDASHDGNVEQRP